MDPPGYQALVSRIRLLQWVAWLAIAGALVAVAIYGEYTPAIGVVQGVALATSGVLIWLEHHQDQSSNGSSISSPSRKRSRSAGSRPG
jgi:multisubunit Na+/H+ antiporter MnhB subunit